jgi:serralysin
MRLRKIIEAEAGGEGRGEFAPCGCEACVGKSALSEARSSSGDPTALEPPEGEVTVGGAFTGELSPVGDIDYIALDVVAGQTYVVVLRGSGATPVEDTLLTVYNASDVEIGFDDDGGAGTSSLLTFTAATTGQFTLQVESFTEPGQPATPGTYTVEVRQRGTDQVTNNFNSAAAIAVDDTTIGFIETNGDKDLYAVQLEAGKTYSFELAGGADYNTPYPTIPAGELDTVLILFGSDRVEIGRSDDLDFPDDISSGFTFTPTESGTYYLRAQAYSGQTGGYSLTVEEFDLTTLDPLDSLDWGTQVGTSNILVYFVPAGQKAGGATSLGWSDYEIQQAMEALEQFENVANVDFQITTVRADADFRLVTTESDQFLGRFSPPGEPNAGVGEFAVNGFGWEDAPGGGLEQGGYGFITLIHEFGHGMGLAHPHDNGGGSDVMFGVTGAFGSYGAFDLNQGVNTMMSYNDGWQLHPDANPDGTIPGDPSAYGYQGTLMAFDVALIQQKYGANTSYRAGADVYVLPDSNESGTFWSCLWDAGGRDRIQHAGPTACVIDLRAATIDYTETGGGPISWVDGVFGGFTIAEGVQIEDARGGAGADLLVGNDGKNALTGGKGADTLRGGDGADALNGGGGADVFAFDDGDSTPGKKNRDVIKGFEAGTDTLDLSDIDAVKGTAADDAFSIVGGDPFTAAGQIRVFLSGGDTVVQGNTDGNLNTVEFEVLLKGEVLSLDFIL